MTGIDEERRKKLTLRRHAIDIIPTLTEYGVALEDLLRGVWRYLDNTDLTLSRSRMPLLWVLHQMPQEDNVDRSPKRPRELAHGTFAGAFVALISEVLERGEIQRFIDVLEAEAKDDMRIMGED